MRIVVLTAALALPLAPAAAQQRPGVPIPARCKPTEGMVAYKPDATVRVQKLSEMPPAVEIKTLWNVVDGCPQPIVVRRGLGNPGRAAAPDAMPRLQPSR